MYKSYDEAYRLSLEDKDGFWSEAAEKIQWDKKWDKVLDDSKKPFYRWFAGGRLNTCYNAIDYHVENGRGDQVAIIYDSPVTGIVRKITYKEFLSEVSLCAGMMVFCTVFTVVPQLVASIASNPQALADFPDLAMPEPASEINLIETFSDTRVIGLTINHEEMTDAEVGTAIALYELELGIPATDALTQPSSRLVDMVLGAFPQLRPTRISAR